MKQITMNGSQVAVAGLSDTQSRWIDSHLPTSADHTTSNLHMSIIDTELREWAAQPPVGASSASLYEDLQYESWERSGTTFFQARALEGVPDHTVAVAETGDLTLSVHTHGSLKDRLPLRILRMVTRGKLLEAGGLLLHASFVSSGEVGYAFIGPSGAGKTTAALLLAALRGSSLVSTDRTVFVNSVDGWRGFGGPEAHRLGLGLINASPSFRRLTHGYRMVSDRIQLDHDEAAGFASSHKFEATFGDLHGIGVKSHDSAPLRCVVLLDSTAESPALHPTTAETVLHHQEDFLFHPDPKLRFPLTRNPLARPEARTTLAALLRDVPLIQLSWNRNQPATLRAQIDDLAAHL